MIYGYCRISTSKQNIERQERNIKNEYPDAIIIKEVFTGTKFQGRKELEKLLKTLKSGDTIVFDSVSRMSRNADEGVETYFELYEKGIQLIFLKEHYIDTAIYADNTKDKIALQGTDEDEIFKGLNNYFRKLAERQIRIAFEQAEKEVMDLRQRTKEGLITAKLNGKSIGRKKGVIIHTKKEIESKEKILNYSKNFNGNLSDLDCMKLLGISRTTYYNYKAQLRFEFNDKISPMAQRISPREKDILKCMAQGMSNDDISTELKIKKSTVKNHISSIFKKLNVTNRVSAIMEAAAENLI